AVRWRAGGSAGCSSGCLGGSLRLRPLLREKEAAQEVGKAPGAPGQPVIALRRRPRGLGAGGLGKEKGKREPERGRPGSAATVTSPRSKAARLAGSPSPWGAPQVQGASRLGTWPRRRA